VREQVLAAQEPVRDIEEQLLTQRREATTEDTAPSPMTASRTRLGFVASPEVYQLLGTLASSATPIGMDRGVSP